MEFEFNNQLVPQGLIDIDNIGEFAIEATNDEGYSWYYIVKTGLGTATIATCGPVVPDVDLLPSGFAMTLTKMQYREDKIAKNISFFLNDKSKAITKAKEIKIDEALDQFRDLGEYIRNYSEEIY